MLNGSFEAHLTPRLEFGVDILGGTARAGVFADLDTSARLELSLQAKANGTSVANPNVDLSTFKASLDGSVRVDSNVSFNVGARGSLRTSAPSI